MKNDWADEIVNEIEGEYYSTPPDHGRSPNFMRMKRELHKAYAMGWREAGEYCVGCAKEADSEAEGKILVDIGFELITEADDLEKRVDEHDRE